MNVENSSRYLLRLTKNAKVIKDYLLGISLERIHEPEPLEKSISKISNR
jgi:hypothetical protein